MLSITKIKKAPVAMYISKSLLDIISLTTDDCFEPSVRSNLAICSSNVRIRSVYIKSTLYLASRGVISSVYFLCWVPEFVFAAVAFVTDGTGTCVYRGGKFWG